MPSESTSPQIDSNTPYRTLRGAERGTAWRPAIGVAGSLLLSVALAACGSADTARVGGGDEDGTTLDAEGDSSSDLGLPRDGESEVDDAGERPDTGDLDGSGDPAPDAFVPPTGDYGDACSSEDECRRFVCLELADASGSVSDGFCSSFCFVGDDCPEAWDCVLLRGAGADASKVCLPRELCIDGDEDGYGLGPSCLGSDCDDSDPDVNPAAEERCDGADNDCDGNFDENAVDANQDCETGFEGVCAEGRSVCDGGLLLCAPLQRSSAEVCDGLDNDCDGEVDEDSDGEALRRACYAGPGDTAGFGVCQAGTRRCTAGEFGECEGQVLPLPERCDGLDNDCDGEVDEGDPGSGVVCPTGAEGVCARGITACNDGALECVPEAEASPEICDGRDNDCDGSIDEGEGEDAAPLSRTCYEGPAETADVGACASGTQSCLGGEFGLCVGDILPAAEVCDGVDNDCDGSVDEDNPGGGIRCDTGALGVCSVGTTDCRDGAIVCVPDAEASDEICDGFDNDCDGSTDEDPDGRALARACYEGPADTRDVGRCMAGSQTCTFGEWGTCIGQVVPSDEVCDTFDNDCDGATDEGVTTTFWRDADGDNYGDPTKPREACFRPGGYAANNRDCYDGNELANPDQRGFFETHRGDGSFDYNCDGDSTRQNTRTGACEANFGLCQLTVGWRGGVPGCGGSGDFLFECRGVLTFCSDSTERAIQTCR